MSEQKNQKTEKTGKQNNQKNRTVKKNQLNRLKNHKIFMVRFGFQSLKLIEPNQTGSTKLALEKKKQV